MILYRAMCNVEFQDMQKFNSLSWNSKNKWFGTKDFVINRVKDGKFNNSKFCSDRYDVLVKFEFADGYEHIFSKCGNREFRLERKHANQIKLLSFERCQHA